MLFFDLATLSGYACGSNEKGVVGYGTFPLQRTYENIGAFLNEADRKIEKLVDRFQPSLLAFASPWINHRRDTIDGLRKLAGLPNVVEQVADRLGLECQEEREDKICRHFLGREYPRTRERKKMAVKVKCRELGWAVNDDNEADALAGLHYFLCLQEPERALELTPLFKGPTRHEGPARAAAETA